MRLGKKLNRSILVTGESKIARARLSETAKAVVEKLEERRLLSAVYLNFNTASTDFTSNFNVVNVSTASFVYGATSGILDQGNSTPGGGVAIGNVASTTEGTAVYIQGTTPFQDDTIHTISAMVKDSDTVTGDKPLQLGWVGATNESFNGNAGSDFVSARLLGNSFGISQVGVSATGAVTNGTATSFSSSATLGDWLQLTVQAQETNTTTGTFNINYQVVDFGQNGTSAGTVLVPFSNGANGYAQATVAALKGATQSFYPAFRYQAKGLSDVDNFAVDPVTPAAPTLAVPTVNNNAVSLSWAPGDGSVTSYTVLRGRTSTNLSPIATNLTTTSYSDIPATPGEYYYAVEAITGTAASAESGVQSALVGFAAVPGNNSVALTWAAPPGATSYEILRAAYDPATQITASYSQLTPGTTTSTSYTDSTAVNGTDYSYELQTLGGLGAGLAEFVIAEPQAAPATVTFNNGSTDLTNNFVEDFDGSIFPSRNFYYNATIGVDDGPAAISQGGLTTTNNNTTNDATLVYDGSSYNLADGATVSMEFQDPAPGTDRVVQVGFINQLNSSFNGDITTPAKTAFIGVRPYGNGELEFQYKLPTNVGATNLALVPAGNSSAPGEWYNLTFTVVETAPGSGKFNYSTQLVDFGLTGTSPVAVVDNVTSTAPISVPGFDPTNGSGANTGWAAVRQVTDDPNLDNINVTGTAAAAGPTLPSFTLAPNDSQVLLNWTSYGALTFQIYRSTSATNLISAGNLLTTANATFGTSSYAFLDNSANDTTLGAPQNGTLYYYQIVPVHGSLVGTASAVLSTTPGQYPPVPVTGPAASVSAVSPTSAIVNVTWNADNFTTAYQIWRATVTNGQAGTYTQIGTTASTTFTDSSTTDPTSPPTYGGDYDYYVTASNTFGGSTPSVTTTPNLTNGAEDYIYSNTTWKAPAGLSVTTTPAAYNEVGLNYDAYQYVPAANVSSGAVPAGGFAASPVTAQPAFTGTNFSQIITGKVIVTDSDLGLPAGDATDTEPVTFGILTDDGGALYVGGNMVAEDNVFSGGALAFLAGATNGGGTMAPLNLHAGTYDFQLFEQQGGGAWESEMEWSTPATQGTNPGASTLPNTFVIVPQASLLIQTGAPAAPSGLSLAAPIQQGNPVSLTWTNNADNELEEIVQESNNAGFSTANGGTVQTLATLPMNNANPVAGTTTTGAYSDSTNPLTGTEYYRIESVNFDGTSSIVLAVGPTVNALQAIPARITAPFDSLQVTLSEPIDVSSFDPSQLQLSFDGSPTPTSTLSLQSDGGDLYEVDGLSALTSATGAYVFDFNADSVTDANGVQGSGSLSESWTLLAAATLSALNPPTPITYDGTSDVTSWAAGTASGPGNLPVPTGPVTPVFFSGSAATGTPLASSPIDAGTYTAELTYAGDAVYASATGAPATFTINQAAATVGVTDVGGAYTGSPLAATATVNGAASLQGVTPTLAYYAGTAAAGTPLGSAPSTTGTYTAQASFAGSSDYTSASSSAATFTISRATPTITVSDAAGAYTGSAYPATARVNGSSSLEGITPTLSYYAGTSASGTPLGSAPIAVGTYTAQATFAGSSDYAAASGAVIFHITQGGGDTVTVSDAGGTFTGSAFPAIAQVNGSSSLEGVTPTIAYYASTAATGTPLSGAPITTGVYTAVASFAGSADYASAASSPATFTIAPGIPTLTVSDAGGTYSGSTFPATVQVNGSSSLEGVTPMLVYYAGTAATGTPLSGSPRTAGTYTVAASFAGSTDFRNASATATFTVARAAPTVVASDASGNYTGSAFPATATVDGSSSLEGVSPSVAYYAGSASTGTPLGAAPSAVGTYTVVASFAGSTDYAPASSAVAFQIVQAGGAVVTVSDPGGTYTGAPFPATAQVNGSAALEGVTPTLSYYSGTAASGTPLSGAPTATGTYAVVASFAGSSDYAPASSTPATFTIAPDNPTVTVTDAGGTYTGLPFAATDQVNGSVSLEGVTPSVTYYAGSTAAGTPLSAAPTTVGTYTVQASFAGSSDYAAASSTPATFTIGQATPTVAVSATVTLGTVVTPTEMITGVDGTAAGSLEAVTPTFNYYSGTTSLGSTAPTAPGSYTVVASFAGSADYGPAASPPASFILTTPVAPTLSSTQVNDGSIQRSTVSSITLTFAAAVNFTAASFTLSQSQNDTTWTPLSSGLTLTGSNGGKSWTISCTPGSSLDRSGAKQKGYFVDGIYQLTLHGSAITDAATGVAQYNGGADKIAQFANGKGVQKNAFSVLYGDMAGTATVNNADYGQFKNAFGATSTQSKYIAALDFTGGGIINNATYNDFKNNFGKTYVFG